MLFLYFIVCGFDRCANPLFILQLQICNSAHIWLSMWYNVHVGKQQRHISQKQPIRICFFLRPVVNISYCQKNRSYDIIINISILCLRSDAGPVSLWSEKPYSAGIMLSGRCVFAIIIKWDPAGRKQQDSLNGRRGYTQELRLYLLLHWTVDTEPGVQPEKCYGKSVMKVLSLPLSDDHSQ